ncbi:SirB2 family protein [Gilvimarinus gilvus]|nr:SirB2 family protein [Gilvimarinus sp. SDUM040013]
MYIALKHSHMLLVAISVLLFFTRYISSEVGAQFVKAKFFKIAPHIVDTLLLATGIALIFTVGYSLWPINWLTVKIALVVAYIIAGTVAMKGAGKGKRRVAALVALICIMGILHLALSKSF